MTFHQQHRVAIRVRPFSRQELSKTKDEGVESTVSPLLRSAVKFDPGDNSVSVFSFQKSSSEDYNCTIPEKTLQQKFPKKIETKENADCPPPKFSHLFWSVPITESFPWTNEMADQGDVYERFARPAVLAALNDRRDVTILAFGGTGAGKDFNLFGYKHDAAELTVGNHVTLKWGIIPRSLQEVFTTLTDINQHPQKAEVRVHMSAFRLYNGELHDLSFNHTHHRLKSDYEKKDQNGNPPQYSDFYQHVLPPPQAMKLKFSPSVAACESASSSSSSSSNGLYFPNVEICGVYWRKICALTEGLQFIENAIRNSNIESTHMGRATSAEFQFFDLKLTWITKHNNNNVDDDDSNETKRELQTNDSSSSCVVIRFINFGGAERLRSVVQAPKSNEFHHTRINVPFFCLERCLRDLVEKKNKFIPVRDSKLSSLLVPVLSKKSLVFCLGVISPHPSCTECSLLTLEFLNLLAQHLAQ